MRIYLPQVIGNELVNADLSHLSARVVLPEILQHVQLQGYSYQSLRWTFSGWLMMVEFAERVNCVTFSCHSWGVVEVATS